MKKLLCILLAALMLLPLGISVFAEEADDDPTEPVTFEYLDTSALDIGAFAFVGAETYVVIYPMPEGAEAFFDVNNAVIEVEDDAVVGVRPEKEEEFTYGCVMLEGKKLGATKVTVTDPDTGISCSFRVIVLPKFIYTLRNLYTSMQYVPYIIGMRILNLFSR